MGVDEGKAKAENFVQFTDWENAQSVTGFLQNVDQALHADEREKPRRRFN